MNLEKPILTVALLLSLSVSVASAHEGETDAEDCHGTLRIGVTHLGMTHCHTDSAPLGEMPRDAVNMQDAMLAARAPSIPECMTCDDVADAQRALKRLGHHPGPIDGILGPQTRAAILSYQRATGLKADGYLSEALLARLMTES